MKKVFIDGSAGTTGLRIRERLISRDDITIIELPDEHRKVLEKRKEAMKQADIVFLCLPDDAAREAVTLVDNPHTIIIDASTAHRTEMGWTYGFPELSKEQYQAVSQSSRIAVPGCHASGFIALVYPLISAGVISSKILLSCFSLTGYSGGGKKMIAEYEGEGRDTCYDAPRIYALGQTHKHLKEMAYITGLHNAPVFSPIVSDFYSGMLVSIPLFSSMTKGGIEAVKEVLRSTYQEGMVRFVETFSDDGFASSNALSGTDIMEVSVCGNEERFTLCARYDNLGKGASGAAIECMNLVLGLPSTYGLVTTV